MAVAWIVKLDTLIIPYPKGRGILGKPRNKKCYIFASYAPCAAKDGLTGKRLMKPILSPCNIAKTELTDVLSVHASVSADYSYGGLYHTKR
jgi:hypothetical protein